MYKAGWVHKLGAKRKSWKKRWCVLTETSLLYFKKKPAAGKKPKPQVRLYFLRWMGRRWNGGCGCCD